MFKDCDCNKFHKMDIPKHPASHLIGPKPFIPCPPDDKTIHIENHPDEEDLTEVSVGDELVLKFKDKMYDPGVFSGMGRVYLRKNLVTEGVGCALEQKNVLTQEMFYGEDELPMKNTIFIIQYDYDLNNKFISIPENCILLFAGGSLSNGTLLLDDTLFLPLILEYNTFVNCNVKGNFKSGLVFYTGDKLQFWDGECWMTIGLSDSKYLETLISDLNDRLTQALEDIQNLLQNYLTEERAKCLFVLLDVLSNYMTRNEANNTFLSKTLAANTYATKEEVNELEIGSSFVAKTNGTACDLNIGVSNAQSALLTGLTLTTSSGTKYLVFINNEGLLYVTPVNSL